MKSVLNTIRFSLSLIPLKMPFKHPHLGYGFDILPYAFESYYECEKTLIDVSGNIAKNS